MATENLASFQMNVVGDRQGMPVGLGLTALQYVADLLRDTLSPAGER